MLVLLVLQVLIIVYTFNFVYNDGVRERCFLSCHEHGTKKKFFGPHEELNLRPSHSYALLLSHKDSVVSMANTKLIYDSSCELRIVFFFPCS